MNSEPPAPEAKSPATPRRRGRVYAKYAVGVLATFGVLGAVGGRVVDKVFSSAEEKINPEKTVLVGVREDPQGGSDGFTLARRSSTGLDTRLASVKDCDALMTAAKSVGAVDVRVVREALVLEGGTHRDLSIVDMHAKIVKREPALRGAEILCQSAGAVGAIGVLFNLDEARPVARTITQPESLQFDGPYFSHGKIVRLVKGEIQPFELIGISSRDFVEWEVEADVIIDGETETITINNGGEPFRVSGPPPAKTGYERYYEWQWYRQPPQMWMADRRPQP
jgi:hypothetical protein